MNDPDEVTAEDCMWIVVELMLMLMLMVLLGVFRERERERDGDRCMRVSPARTRRKLFSTCRRLGRTEIDIWERNKGRCRMLRGGLSGSIYLLSGRFGWAERNLAG